jgi:phosphoribosyl 1,2-cyclic phosphate phosphodiesterase
VSARLKATILGCGSSPGVPRIGNDWGACDPNEPRNRRTRCSLLLERYATGDTPTRVLVDTGPDMRAQLLAADVGSIDAVIFTHAHADHTHGIDDLRAFWLSTHKLVETYADEKTQAHLERAFGYCFAAPDGSAYPPILKHTPMPAEAPVTIAGAGGPLTITPFRQANGEIETMGLRIGGLAYSPDVSDVPETSLPYLADLDVWIVDALRYRPHPSHFSVSEAIAWSKRLGVRRAVLTHMHIDLDYATLKRDLPEGVEPACDGMTIELPLD